MISASFHPINIINAKICELDVLMFVIARENYREDLDETLQKNFIEG